MNDPGLNGGVTVELDAVHKRFETDSGVVKAVDDVTLEVAAGEGLAVTGPSGCGKSTLLSMIGALELPSAGQVSVGGARVSAMDERARARLRRAQIGFVFQSDNLQPFLTAGENVSLMLALADGGEHYGRTLELLGSLGLAEVAAKYPDQLSGGERQRVAVARALVHRPRLILADEPTGSLDSGNSRAVIDLLREAQAESAATLIVITHDQAIAQRLDRRITLGDGHIVDGAAVPAATAQQAFDA